MITLTFTRIRLGAGVVLTPTPFTLYYKNINDSIWTLIASNVYVDLDGYILASPAPSITVPGPGYYVLRAVNDFCGIDYQEGFPVNEEGLYEWVEDDNYCEQENPLNLVDTISGFADPYLVGYDEVSERMYFVDGSAITQGSNIYSGDPDTMVSASDVTPHGSINVAALAQLFDGPNRMIYITGPDTSGLIAYNIATGSVTNVAFGTNGSYARLTLVKYGDTILSLSTVGSQANIVDASTLTLTSNIPYASIPDYEDRFSGGPLAFLINNKWWILNSQGSTYGVVQPSIGVYSSDFSVLESTIALPGQLTWTNSAYWRTGIIIDGLLFIYDAGSNQLLTVDINTQVVTSRYVFTNREGKTNSFLSVIQDPVTLELYISGNWTNDANTDLAPIQVTYRLNSTTFQPDTIYPAIQYGTNIARKTGTDVLVGVAGGIPVYPTNPPGAATDGEVNIFSKSGVGNNTGIKVVLTLQEINTVTDQPTGNTKPNVIGDVDYIAPYEDLVNCPISYTMLCPETTYTIVAGVAEYEYSLAPSTYTNPSINNILLQQIDTVTSAVLASFVVPLNAYQHGYITKIGSNANRIDLLFKDASNNTLATCSNIFTIP